MTLSNARIWISQADHIRLDIARGDDFYTVRRLSSRRPHLLS